MFPERTERCQNVDQAEVYWKNLWCGFSRQKIWHYCCCRNTIVIQQSCWIL